MDSISVTIELGDDSPFCLKAKALYDLPGLGNEVVVIATREIPNEFTGESLYV